MANSNPIQGAIHLATDSFLRQTIALRLARRT